MSSSATAVSPARDYRAPMMIIGLLFFIFGFVTWLNGPLIQFVELAFDLDTVNAFLVLMVFYLSYFFLALPSSWILSRTGMKKGMALGLLVMAAGAVVFGEFVVRRWYPGALTGLFVIGAGLALLQTAAKTQCASCCPAPVRTVHSDLERSKNMAEWPWPRPSNPPSTTQFSGARLQQVLWTMCSLWRRCRRSSWIMPLT